MRRTRNALVVAEERTLKQFFSVGLCCAVLGSAGFSAAAFADAIEDAYKGKQISILIGYAPGGGYDLNARVVSRYISRHIPGAPSVVARNMPGAGSMKAANYIYSLAPKDGTEFGTFARTVPIDPLLGGQGSQFDALKFNWIGSTSNEVSTCVAWHTSPVKTIDDLMHTELIVSATGVGSPSVVFPKLMNEMLGTKFKFVTGYPGSTESVLAMERGEVSGYCAWGWIPMIATKGQWLQEGKLNVLVQTGMKKQAGRESIPLALDLARNAEDRQVMELVFAPQTFARPFAAPPDVAADRIAALRVAFEATTKDTQFLADAEKQKLEIDYVSGQEIEAILKRLYQSPPSVVARARAAMGEAN